MKKEKDIKEKQMIMDIKKELEDVEKRLENSTSYKNKRDLGKYRKKLLKQLKKGVCLYAVYD